MAGVCRVNGRCVGTNCAGGVDVRYGLGVYPCWKPRPSLPSRSAQYCLRNRLSHVPHQVPGEGAMPSAVPAPAGPAQQAFPEDSLWLRPVQLHILGAQSIPRAQRPLVLPQKGRQQPPTQWCTPGLLGEEYAALVATEPRHQRHTPPRVATPMTDRCRVYGPPSPSQRLPQGPLSLQSSCGVS